MKLHFFQGQYPNFGDELNPWMWPKLLPNFFDEDSSKVFLGIGSIIGLPCPEPTLKIVAGAAYVPLYHPQIPNINGADWDVLFVRGKKSAHMLGLPENIGIGDPATLLRLLTSNFQRETTYVSFMPHFQSLQVGNWELVCKLAGIRLIDPRDPVEKIIFEILTSKVLITEAMHGAIVADTLRVPWIPVLPIDSANRIKWYDWSDTLGLDLLPYRLWPSSLGEAERLIKRHSHTSSVPASTVSHTTSVMRRTLSRSAKPFITYVAAQRLSYLATRDPTLSQDGACDIVVERMLEKVSMLEKKYRR